VEAECLPGAKQGLKHLMVLQLPPRKGQGCLQILGDPSAVQSEHRDHCRGWQTPLSWCQQWPVCKCKKFLSHISSIVTGEEEQELLPDPYDDQVVRATVLVYLTSPSPSAATLTCYWSSWQREFLPIFHLLIKLGFFNMPTAPAKCVNFQSLIFLAQQPQTAAHSATRGSLVLHKSQNVES